MNQQDTSLENQELAFQQCIINLKEELVAAETALAQTSEQHVLVQAQLKAKKEEGAMLRDQISTLQAPPHDEAKKASNRPGPIQSGSRVEATQRLVILNS